MECAPNSQNDSQRKWRGLSEARYIHKANRSRSPIMQTFCEARKRHKLSKPAERVEEKRAGSIQALQAAWERIKTRSLAESAQLLSTVPIKLQSSPFDDSELCRRIKVRCQRRKSSVSGPQPRASDSEPPEFSATWVTILHLLTAHG